MPAFTPMTKVDTMEDWDGEAPSADVTHLVQISPGKWREVRSDPLEGKQAADPPHLDLGATVYEPPGYTGQVVATNSSAWCHTSPQRRGCWAALKAALTQSKPGKAYGSVTTSSSGRSNSRHVRPATWDTW